MNLYDLFNLTANATQFVNLSKNFADDNVFAQILKNQEEILGILKGEPAMKLLTCMVDKAHDTIDEVIWYAEKALQYKGTHKSIADIYNKIAEMHINIFDMLHNEINKYIDEHKRINQVPVEMTAVWEYEHSKLLKKYSKGKTLVDEYKKSY
jgi:hypothetical protein